MSAPQGTERKTAGDLLYEARQADRWVVYVPPTLDDSRAGIHGRYVAVQLPPCGKGAKA